MELSNEQELFYRDSDVKITYTFTNNQILFLVWNLSDKDMTVDLSRSFLCLNGIAFDYYQDKTVWTAAGSSTSSVQSYTYSNSQIGASGTTYSYWSYNPLGGVYNSNSNVNVLSTYSRVTSTQSNCNFDADATSYKTKPMSIIPGGFGKFFCEFPVLSFRYTNDNLNDYPKDSNSAQFSEKSASPYVFINRIMLVFDGVDKPISNEFHVSEITNYKKEAMMEVIGYQTTEGPVGPVKEALYAPNTSLITPNRTLIFYYK